jgi:ribonuclease D
VPDADYLVDPLVLEDLSALGPLLADAKVLKVFHGGEYDLRVLHRDFAFSVANLFDTMWASRILGWSAHGLGALLESHFGVKLNKKYQRANWGVRPLPPAQLDYARLDTHYLLKLYEIQAGELTAQKRWPQARHRFSRVAESRWEPKEFDPDGFWRIAGARELDDAGRGVLRELYRFREQQAQAENRPPFRVLSNQALLGASERRPQNLQSLRQVKGVSPRMAGRYGKDLLAAIRRGASRPLSWEERVRPPHGSRKPNGRPSAACQARFEALRAWRNMAAEARGVEPDMVLTNHVLWDVASHNPRCRADLGCIDALARWQTQEFGDDLLKVVQRTG